MGRNIRDKPGPRLVDRTWTDVIERPAWIPSGGAFDVGKALGEVLMGIVTSPAQRFPRAPSRHRTWLPKRRIYSPLPHPGDYGARYMKLWKKLGVVRLALAGEATLAQPLVSGRDSNPRLPDSIGGSAN